ELKDAIPNTKENYELREKANYIIHKTKKVNKTRKINNLSLLMLILKISKGKFPERRNNAYFVKQFSKSHWRKSQKCFLSKRISQ
ncbi:MAG: hypothetical protein CMH07_01115, partial [Marinovum sp.]|nr:hypothetical protein [Marinovum sp.]